MAHACAYAFVPAVAYASIYYPLNFSETKLTSCASHPHSHIVQRKAQLSPGILFSRPQFSLQELPYFLKPILSFENLQSMNNFELFPFNKVSVDRPYTFFRFKLEQTFFKIRQGSRLFSYSNLVEQDSIIVYMLCVLY